MFSYIFLLTCILTICIFPPMTTSLPVEGEDHARTTRQIEDNFGFPDEEEVVRERPTNSCFVSTANTYNVERNLQLVNGKIVQQPKRENETVDSRECCEGYTGVDCNIRVDPYSASDPCRNKTCPEDPEAQCAVINQCGSRVHVFLNELGQIVDCGTEDDEEEEEEEGVADADITTLSCQGYCSFDPCRNQACDLFPDAFCFQSGCDCEPVWILDTGVQVNCTTGDHVDPLLSVRNRRQAAMIPLPASCR